MVDQRWAVEFQGIHFAALIDRLKQDIANPGSGYTPLRRPIALRVLSAAAASGCTPARAELRLVISSMIAAMLEVKTRNSGTRMAIFFFVRLRY
jgi:hypothetical protein